MSIRSKVLVATAVFLTAGWVTTAALAADAPAAGAGSSKMNTGLTPLAQLLQLMDTDKNGKVSKDEFMKFMSAEFDYADTSKDGDLDPAELKALVYKMNHPYHGMPRVGK